MFIKILLFYQYIFFYFIESLRIRNCIFKIVNNNYNILSLKNTVFVRLFFVGIISGIVNFFFPLTNNITLVILFLIFFIFILQIKNILEKNLLFIFL